MQHVHSDELRAEIERLKFELKAKSHEISIADEVIERLKRERDEAHLEAQDNHSALVGTKVREDALALRAARAECERDAARVALEIIAGKRQCIDNLMSNVEIARCALEQTADETMREIMGEPYPPQNTPGRS